MSALLLTLGGSLLQVVLPLVVTAAGGVFAKLWGFLHAKTKSTAANTALDILQNLVTSVVQSLEQTMVAEFKAKGGTLTAGTADSVKQAAIAQIKKLYGPDGLALLAKSLQVSQDSVLQLIATKIEQAVYTSTGTQQPAPAVAQPAPDAPTPAAPAPVQPGAAPSA